MSESIQQQAVREWREANPYDLDLPDHVVASLSTVQFRVLGLAVRDFGRALKASVTGR